MSFSGCFPKTLIYSKPAHRAPSLPTVSGPGPLRVCRPEGFRACRAPAQQSWEMGVSGLGSAELYLINPLLVGEPPPWHSLWSMAGNDGLTRGPQDVLMEQVGENLKAPHRAGSTQRVTTLHPQGPPGSLLQEQVLRDGLRLNRTGEAISRARPDPALWTLQL